MRGKVRCDRAALTLVKLLNRDCWRSGANVRFAPDSGQIADCLGTSDLCQKATLFDHLVGSSKQCRWNSKTDCFRSFEIDHKFELGGLFDREFARHCSFNDFVNISRSATEQIGRAYTVTHQTSVPHEVRRVIDSWYATALGGICYTRSI